MGRGDNKLLQANATAKQVGMSRRSPTRFIYFFLAEEFGKVKIGISDDPAQRLRSLQAAGRLTVRYLGCLPGTLADKKVIHEQWTHLRINGEWFRQSEELLAWIVANASEELPTPPQRREVSGVAGASASRAHDELLSIGDPVITTGEAATKLHISHSRASHVLGSMEAAGLVLRLRRGLWRLRSEVSPFSLAPYVTEPYPAYVSLWSALRHHDMIEQIPGQTFVASVGRTRRVTTSIGSYSIHHLAPEVFNGYGGSVEDGYVATPEKALFDIIYVRAPRGGQAYFPELSLPNGFDEDELARHVQQVKTSRLRTLVSRGLEDALRQARA